METEPQVQYQFEESLYPLSRERDFQSFPSLRRAVLELTRSVPRVVNSGPR